MQVLRGLDPPCPWNEWTCHNAAENGHLDVLKWLRAQTPPVLGVRGPPTMRVEMATTSCCSGLSTTDVQSMIQKMMATTNQASSAHRRTCHWGPTIDSAATTPSNHPFNQSSNQSIIHFTHFISCLTGYSFRPTEPPPPPGLAEHSTYSTYSTYIFYLYSTDKRIAHTEVCNLETSYT